MTALCAAAERSALLDHNPAFARSIELRNPCVDPLNILQAEALRRHRAEGSPAVLEALHVTINRVAAGVRNTG